MASPTNVRFCRNVHEQLTRQAIGDSLPPADLDRVVSANVHQDTLEDEIFSHSQYHFDNCAFPEGAAYIEEQRRIVEFQPGCRSETALDAFGRLLHAVQDFYAHSNWVELHSETESPIPLWDLQLTSLPNGIVSGTWAAGHPKKCGAGAPPHSQLNKDSAESPEGKETVTKGPNAGKTLFELAYDAALRATGAQLDRFNR